MALAQQARLDANPGEVRGYDVAPSLGYTGFVILLLIAVYFGAMCCGTSPGDLPVMTVLP